ncbi:MAG: amino acid ABC transporter substrate-binding protein [Xanthobacteraceae bacterium]|uniref:amino acid ABC transporter substrate-binding protein n=1 Tax=Pseudolabrys sp. TaxID=1960880 RepID=UPI003D111728
MRGWLIPPAVVLTLALALPAQPATAGVLDRVKETGVFRIGYRADAPPYSYQDSRGRPAGYIVDLCREVAAALGSGVKPQYVLVHAGERFKAVHDGKIDILCDPSSITLERRATVDFSMPTFLDGAGVLSRQSKPVQRFEDLDRKRVGVLIGTTTERVLTDALKSLGVNATIVPVLDHRNGMKMVEDTDLDAYVADRSILAAMLREGGRPGFELSRRYFSYETYGLALPHNDSAFRLLVDKTLAQLYRSGRIKAILAKTFGDAPSDEMLEAMFVINSLPER